MKAMENRTELSIRKPVPVSDSTPRRLHRTGIAALAAALVFSTFVPATPAAGEDFKIDLISDGLSVSGATAGGEVQVFGLWRQRHVTWSEVGRVFEQVTDSDADGAVTWSLGREIPIASALFAVDLATGAWGVAVPPGFPPRVLPPAAIRLASDGSSFSVAADAVELLVVRPGQGSWSLRARDGGPVDTAITQDGSIALSLGQLEPRNDEPGLTPPQAFRDGDLLFGIGTNSLKIFVEVIAGEEK